MALNILKPKLKKRSDEELIAGFISTGDLETLGELYSGYMHLVYGVCLKYLKSSDEAMDAVMMIFENLITAIPKQKIENFSGWLHVVTKNYCLMQIRSQKSKDERFEDWKNESAVFMENDPYLHPVDNDGPEMEEALADCITKLKEDQKRCIRLFYYENKCYDEIALDMGIDEKKVKSYLQNGKRNLKLCLEAKNGR